MKPIVGFLFVPSFWHTCASFTSTLGEQIGEYHLSNCAFQGRIESILD